MQFRDPKAYRPDGTSLGLRVSKERISDWMRYLTDLEQSIASIN